MDAIVSTNLAALCGGGRARVMGRGEERRTTRGKGESEWRRKRAGRKVAPNPVRNKNKFTKKKDRKKTTVQEG